jgi:putative membrane protein
MNEPAEVTRRADLRDYLAAERTLLAWLRTGLALMGFGFVVARFGIFLRQFQLIQHAPLETSHGLSLWFGTALIVVGVLVNLFSGLQYARLVRELDRGEPVHVRPATFVVTIALFLAIVGLAMAIYLVSIGGSVYSQSLQDKPENIHVSHQQGR